jgi:hypothetical protein
MIAFYIILISIAVITIIASGALVDFIKVVLGLIFFLALGYIACTHGV